MVNKVKFCKSCFKEFKGSNKLFCDACCEKLKCPACFIIYFHDPMRPNGGIDFSRVQVGRYYICRHCLSVLEKAGKIMLKAHQGYEQSYLYKDGRVKIEHIKPAHRGLRG